MTCLNASLSISRTRSSRVTSRDILILFPVIHERGAESESPSVDESVDDSECSRCLFFFCFLSFSFFSRFRSCFFVFFSCFSLFFISFFSSYLFFFAFLASLSLLLLFPLLCVPIDQFCTQSRFVGYGVK